MNFDSETRTRLIVTVVTDFDPADATLEVKVDTTWHAATWTGAAVKSSNRWTRVGRTVGYFAGPDATPNGATVLVKGRHATDTRVTAGGDQIVWPSTPVDVG